MRLERRGRVRRAASLRQLATGGRSERSRQAVQYRQEAGLRSLQGGQGNAGGARVDGQTIEQFEAVLGDNLCKLWNRMRSGSYFPPPVRAVLFRKEWRATASGRADRGLQGG